MLNLRKGIINEVKQKYFLFQDGGGNSDDKEDLMSKGQSVRGEEEHFDRIKEHCVTVVALPCYIPNFGHWDLSVSDERCIPYFDIADGTGYEHTCFLMFLHIVHLSHFPKNINSKR